jgi:CHAT domain-containing protein
LFISCAPELAAIPWPVLPVDQQASPVTRLVERFDLRFVPSLALLRLTSETSRYRASDREGEIPLLLTCDYFPQGDAPPQLPARRARTVLAAKELCIGEPGAQEATAVNLVRFLRSLPPGTEGVAFFRTHYEWSEASPSFSGIALADEILPSGLIGSRDESTGNPVLNLPSTVVMSCCSTSGNRSRNGGESLGLAPLAMMAGARRVIATSVEIRHTAFTLALDDMLIDIAVRPGDHFEALHALQLRLLSEWRHYSLRDVETLRDTTPTPDIWAHYLAYGA